MNLDHIWKKVQKDDDTTAFGFLYHLFFSGMCQYASQLTGDRHVAEEVVQDIFLKVWNKRKDIVSRDGSIKKYLFRLTHNQCIDLLRKHHTRKESFIQLLPSDDWVRISETYGFDELLIEQLEGKETVEKIQHVVKQLPVQCREIFMKSRFEYKSNEEIATEMNLSENTVKTQIYRAIKKIKEHFYVYLLIFFPFL